MTVIEEFFRDFALSRGMVIRKKDALWTAQHGALEAVRADFGALEVFVVKRERESSCTFLSSNTDPNFYIQIAHGCLPDYLTLLLHDTYDFTYFGVRNRFERYVLFTTERTHTERFSSTSVEQAGMVVNCFYPRDNSP